MNTIDLFSGCGGLTLGFEWAGFRSVFATDIDENCQKTFARNFTQVPFICKDITEITKEEVDVLLADNKVDLVIGGPPCQGFSLANKNRNKVKNDPRNKLFYEFLKFIEWYQPKAFVMENVKGLLSMDHGQIIKTIVSEFESIGVGYKVRYGILKASDFGVPQHRERVIIIGFRSDLQLIPILPQKADDAIEVSVGQAIGDLPVVHAGEGYEIMGYTHDPESDYQRKMRQRTGVLHNHVAMRHTERVICRFRAIKPGQSLIDVWETHGAVKRGNPNEKSHIRFSQNNQRVFYDKPAPTIAASFQSNFIHPTLDRNFTAREGARLQSFPDSFVFEGFRTKMSWEKGLSQYQQIGNAVPPLLAYAIAKQIKNQLK